LFVFIIALKIKKTRKKIYENEMDCYLLKNIDFFIKRTIMLYEPGAHIAEKG